MHRTEARRKTLNKDIFFGGRRTGVRTADGYTREITTGEKKCGRLPALEIIFLLLLQFSGLPCVARCPRDGETSASPGSHDMDSRSAEVRRIAVNEVASRQVPSSPSGWRKLRGRICPDARTRVFQQTPSKRFGSRRSVIQRLAVLAFLCQRSEISNQALPSSR